MRLPPGPSAPPAGPLRRNLAEGFRYAFGFAPIRALLLLLALVSFPGMPYTVRLARRDSGSNNERDVPHARVNGTGRCPSRKGSR
jgi:hypothetical protein